MSISVINIKDAPDGWRDDPDYVYIGRPGKWGNPFTVAEHGRVGCIQKFCENLENGGFVEMAEDLWELRGKTLVCYCKPLACHGDVLAGLAACAEIPK